MLNQYVLFLGIDDDTGTTIYIRYETGSLHESSTKVNVLVSDCCDSSGRHSTIGRTTMVVFFSSLTNNVILMTLFGKDVRQYTRFLRAAPG